MKRVKRKQLNVPLLLAIELAVLAMAISMAVIPVKQLQDFSAPGPSTTQAPTAAASAITQVAGAPSAAAASLAGFRDTRWSELLPAGWDPISRLDALQQGVRVMSDGDPQAVARLKKIHDIWDNAPVNPAMNGQAVRIPGYVVPVESAKAGVKEFLLVPYFGACIHTPPPPSNQIIHVWSSAALKGLHTMDPVWVSGRLSAARSESDMGPSSYRLDASAVQLYEGTK
jgi:hypothetical protein